MWEVLKFLLTCFLFCCFVSACAFAYMIIKAPEDFIAEEPEDERRG